MFKKFILYLSIESNQKLGTMKNTTTHPSVITLINYILSCIPETFSGTYNRADPTAWSKGHLIIITPDSNYLLEYHDCTWGNTLRISKNGDELGSFYLGWDDVGLMKDGKRINQESVTPRQDTPGLFKLIFQLKPLLEPIPEPVCDDDCYDDPMGCISDYI